MNPVAEDILMHYGMPRRSGRYPWGSGENPYQHANDFIGRVEEMRKSGFTYTDENGKVWSGDTAIAKSMGLTTSQFRTEIGLAKSERRMYDVARVKSLTADGYNDSEIGRIMGINESSVRSLKNENSEARMNQARETANFIKEQVDKKGMIDVGVGVEKELRISKERLDQALYLLEREGYGVYNGRFEQPTNPGKFTTQKVICPPDIKPKEGAKAPAEIYDLSRVHSLNEDNYISRDGGDTFEKKFTYPASLDSNRLMIRYKEDGGIDKDGIVELRRGVDDLSLGESRYSQVRIMVDGKKYIKGMAVYSDDMPDGVDVIFNTNKSNTVSKMDVLKDIKSDPDNPFGSLIKDADQGGQYWYTDKKTGEKKLGLINKRADEGDWTEWADALPSQFLAKQSKALIDKQLGLAKADKEAEFDEICSLTNPTVKKHLLEKFADTCDAAAVNLKAAALPGQKYHVIIPINSLKDNEVYAPGYEPGTKLALVRYPHGGTFEIPILTVNNKNPLGNKIIGSQSIDAIGINKNIADRLSGADFDGDTVMAIPTHDPKGKVKIINQPPLKGLEGFDPKLRYGSDEVKTDPDGTKHYFQNGQEYRIMTKRGTQTQMGIVSNLITDMTLAGAEPDELAAAVRHSMVVIDAEKHKLNYKQSEVDNNIAALHKKYQGKETGGASTILSRAKGETTVDKRQGSPRINTKDKEWYDPSKPEGSLIWNTADDLYYPIRKYNKNTKEMELKTTSGKTISYRVDDKEAANKYAPVKRVNSDTGEVTYSNAAGDIFYKVGKRTQKSTKMGETDDAYSLVSSARNAKELAYADYANNMKDLANRARIEMVNTGKIAYSKNSQHIYQAEVDSLMDKLRTAQLNAPRERAAQRKANADVKAKILADPTMERSDIKKAKQRALTKYREEVGSISRRNRDIDISDREWDAIQAGAISENKLKMILNNTNIDNLRQRATPRATTSLSVSQVNRIKAYSASNYTIGEIAKKLGISTSTVSKYLKGAN